MQSAGMEINEEGREKGRGGRRSVGIMLDPVRVENSAASVLFFTHKRVWARLMCHVYMSGDPTWVQLALKWSYDRSGLGGKV